MINHKGSTVQLDYDIDSREVQVDIAEDGWIIDSKGLPLTPDVTLIDLINSVAEKHNLQYVSNGNNWDIDSTSVTDHIIVTAQLTEV